MTLLVQITGLDQLQNVFDPARFERQLALAINRSAEYARDATKQLPPVSAKTTGYGVPGIPVDSGLMRQRIEKKTLGLLAAGVIANTNYSKTVHDGRANKPPQPFFEDMLERFGGRDDIARIVTSTLQQIFG